MLTSSTYGRQGRIVPIEKVLFMVLGLAVMGASTTASDPFVFTFQELSPGVWTGVRENSPRLPVMGSTTFVVSEEGVVVFDGGGAPLMSERVIEKIRSITNKPVTHVVISHWHGDHNLGIYRYLDEYPFVQTIGHDFTRAAMLGSPMDYARKTDRLSDSVSQIKEALEADLRGEAEPMPEPVRKRYLTFLDDSELIDAEYKRSVITPPVVTFDDRLTIHSGSRTIELLFLGHANTAGDIVMWLPEEKIVAAGDIVVCPTPYGFNVPPRSWAATLRKLEALGADTLVPGHGLVQHDMAYVDLLIETAESIADQRDALLAQGLSQEDAEARLDFSQFIDRFTNGDPLHIDRFNAWFANPFRKAAFKALTGEPMVVINPKTSP